jgi:DNA gyrase subunit A
MTGNVTDVKFKTKKSEGVAKTFNFSELQAQYILDMKLQRLNNLEINQLHELAASLKKEIEGYQKILSSKKNLHAQIAKRLKEIKEKYAQPRKTVIVEDNKELKVVEAAPIIEDVMVLIDRFGYIKTVDMNSYGRTGEESLSMYRTQFQIKNTDKIGVFTKSGNLYQLKVSELPKCKIKDKGQPLDVLCKFKEKETTMLIAPLTKDNVVFVFQISYQLFFLYQTLQCYF